MPIWSDLGKTVAVRNPFKEEKKLEEKEKEMITNTLNHVELMTSTEIVHKKVMCLQGC